MRGIVVALLVGLLTLPARAAGQAAAPPAPATLTLRGLDSVAHVVTPREWAQLPRVDTTVSAHGVTGRYSGVPLTALLALIHAPADGSLRGKALATYILVEAADGYRVVFSLADFDPGFTDRTAIVADRKDGAPLSAQEGPFRLIVPGERRPARWVRMVTAIELRRVP